jgi:nitroimidazol reductase NimA-like FMN-containing flavoprotein (pyridoxamine 5'-phosphate oxidase superfamily)
MSAKSGPELRPSSEKVVAELRKHSFGILGTVSKNGRPHATGVAFGASLLGKPLVLYVVTDTGTKKVRNIRRNPNVSFVIPIPRKLLTMAPMSCIQFQGRARILDSNDAEAIESLRSTRIGRMMLEMAGGLSGAETGGKPTCFIMIIPDPIIHTYGVGLSLLQMRSQAGRARAKVELPLELRVQWE